METKSEKQRKARESQYKDYITRPSKTANATGRREPYHLTYIKKAHLRVVCDQQQSDHA